MRRLTQTNYRSFFGPIGHLRDFRPAYAFFKNISLKITDRSNSAKLLLKMINETIGKKMKLL